jgi:hypothetical protein
VGPAPGPGFGVELGVGVGLGAGPNVAAFIKELPDPQPEIPTVRITQTRIIKPGRKPFKGVPETITEFMTAAWECYL